MIFINAFIVGGIICAIGQFIMDKLKIMPIYVTCLFVVIGALLDFGNFYDVLLDFSGCGAMLPISSFGHAVVHGVMEEVSEVGVMGIFTGVFNRVSTGISSAIVFAFIFGLIFKPKG